MTVNVPHFCRKLSGILNWLTLFERLRQMCDFTAQLLGLMSLFNHEAIPDYLLQGRYLEHPNGKNDFEDDISILRAYSLVGVDVSGTLFEMHRLVQFSTKLWLERYGELTWWQEQYVGTLGEAFPTGNHVDWPICKALFPHVESVVIVSTTRC